MLMRISELVIMLYDYVMYDTRTVVVLRYYGPSSRTVSWIQYQYPTMAARYSYGTTVQDRRTRDLREVRVIQKNRIRATVRII
jgi:hypothetical protein